MSIGNGVGTAVVDSKNAEPKVTGAATLANGRFVGTLKFLTGADCGSCKQSEAPVRMKSQSGNPVAIPGTLSCCGALPSRAAAKSPPTAPWWLLIFWRRKSIWSAAAAAGLAVVVLSIA